MIDFVKLGYRKNETFAKIAGDCPDEQFNHAMSGAWHLMSCKHEIPSLKDKNLGEIFATFFDENEFNKITAEMARLNELS